MPRRPARARIAACLLLASLAQPVCADPAPNIHYAPTENLEHVDVALIDRAEHEIDMAAYVLTDWPVMQALTRAADRGVAIRIYLDGAQCRARAHEGLSGPCRDAGRRDKDQAREQRSYAPQVLSN
jgi:phosphatidylserine/phosphatidylglycerophosphate/cardiolipin synthase-like enzyme